MNISVIIPTYKNKELLLTNLKHNLEYLKDCEVIVVNDDPTESLKATFESFHQVKLIENKTNLGFGMTVNKGVAEATNSYIMLLNTDVVLHDDSFKKSLVHFTHNPLLFGVSFAQRERQWQTVGKNSIYWKNGFALHTKARNLFLGPNGWAEGGSCMLDKSKFLELNGFDKLYSPFYWEDIDLSYRAWKAGYEVLFDPEILVEHNHESTIGKYFHSQKIKTIAYRNQFLFIWKNITDNRLLLQHWILLPKHILYYLLRGDFAFLFGFFQALTKLPVPKGRVAIKRTDYEIFSFFSN